MVQVSASRHIDAGLSGSALADADIARAARLLETGLWSFSLFAQGKRTQRASKDAAQSMDDARAQVQKAMRDARGLALGPPHPQRGAARAAPPAAGRGP